MRTLRKRLNRVEALLHQQSEGWDVAAIIERLRHLTADELHEMTGGGCSPERHQELLALGEQRSKAPGSHRTVAQLDGAGRRR